jgi:uncharacterized membrane protein YdjX (TVP38/TMEM64 family)
MFPQSPRSADAPAQTPVPAGDTTAPSRLPLWLPSLASCLALVAMYVAVMRYVVGPEDYRSFMSRALLSSSVWTNYAVFCLLISLALLLPGSAAVLILAALPVWGPSATFVLAFVGGLSATVLAHQLGWWLRSRDRDGRRWTKVQAVHVFLTQHERRIWMLAFATRAIPNPFYDVWAYAFGFFRVPLRTYLPPATLGGAIALAVLCYVPWLLTR